MARSQNSFIKRQKEKERAAKKKEKEKKRQERKENNNKGSDLEDMIAYVDEFGNITDKPPENWKEDQKKDKTKKNNN